MLSAVSPHLGASGNGSSFADSQGLVLALDKDPSFPERDCSELVSLTDFSISLISASMIPASPETPEHCLVHGVISPEIEFVALLPTVWNGRLYVHGNGGDAGESVYGEFGKSVRNTALKLGFVATFSNAGHDGGSYSGTRWAYNSLQREIDYSFRALHLNTVAVKNISQYYYGKQPAYSYFDGCSTGGGQAFKEAQRFPEDFDGILAGAPVSDPFTLLLYIWNNQKAQELMRFDRQRTHYLGKLIMDKYDTVDGLGDGVISDPAAIDFDPGRDLPRDHTGKNGFTDREIEGLTLAYGGLVHENRLIAEGLPIGAELPGLTYTGHGFDSTRHTSAWVDRLIPGDSGSIVMRQVMQDWFRYLLLDQDEPNLDWKTMQLADILKKMEARRPLLTASDPNLQRLKARGAKLLIYNGWGDVGVNPYFVINYYKAVREIFQDETDDFTRLFLIPGMFHCRGGLNVDRFDGMTALINWVEGKKPPDSIPASRIEDGRITRTRPLCPYPQVAMYDGHGDINQAGSFMCRRR